MKYKHLIVEVIAALLIFLFVYTGTSKLYERNIFALQLESFPYIHGLGFVISWLLPFAELFTAALMVIPRSRLAGLYLSSLLLCLFTLYLVTMQLTEKNLPCSCGGVISTLSWKQHIMLNLFFITLSVVGMWQQKKVNNKQLTPLNSLLQ